MYPNASQMPMPGYDPYNLAPIPQGYPQQPMPQMPMPQSYPQQPMPQGYPQQPAPAPQAPFDIAAWAQAKGYDVDQAGGAEKFLDALSHGVDRASELEQQLQTNMQASAPAASAPAETDWKQYQQFMARDDSGRIVPKPGSEYAVPYGALNAANEEQTQRQGRMESMLTNPAEFMQEQIGPYLQEQIAEGVKTQREQEAHQKSISDFMAENASVIYQRDAAGNPTNQMTPEGQRLQQIAAELKANGVPDNQIFPIAESTFKGELLQEQLKARTQYEEMQQQIQRINADPQRRAAAMQHLQQVQQSQPQQQMQPQPQQQMQPQPQQQMQPQPQQQPQPQPPPQRYMPSTGPQMPWQVPEEPVPGQQLMPGQLPMQQPQQVMPWQAPNAQQSQPQDQNFLQQQGLSPEGSQGAWNEQTRAEVPFTDDDVEMDAESILRQTLDSQGMS